VDKPQLQPGLPSMTRRCCC